MIKIKIDLDDLLIAKIEALAKRTGRSFDDVLKEMVELAIVEYGNGRQHDKKSNHRR